VVLRMRIRVGATWYPALFAGGAVMEAVECGGYELRPLDLSPAGVEEISRLLLEVFPAATHLTPAYIDWMYIRNPVGRAIGANAYRGGRAVGHYVTIPLRARLFGAEARGVHSLNGAVHPDHQGKRLYAQLGSMTHDWLQAQGWEFAIGVPNANSTHVFAKTFGFQLVCALQARLGVGPIRRAGERSQTDYERIWDEPTVRWRLDNPSARYTYRRRGGCCEVRAPTGRPLIRALLGEIDSAWAPPEGERGDAATTLFIGADPDIRWSRSPYWNLPRRLRPAPLNFVFRDLSGRERRIDPARLRYSALDFDAY
jgi:GNAT superfamily N-acetyltransferase